MHANIKLNSTKKTYAKILLLASVGLVLAFICGLSVSADTYESDNFQVLDPVIGAGANRGTSDNYILWQSLGEIGLGKSTASGYFELNPGFLAWPISSPASNVSASAGNGQVTVSWTAGTGFLGWRVSGYTIGQSTVSGGPYTYSSKGDVTSATISSLTNGTTYYFVVINEDAFGNYIATSTEVSATPTGGGGGGGGGGGYVAPPTATKVIIKGKAYPEAEITLLSDGKIVATTEAGSLANFNFEITDITSGIYTFSLWAVDKDLRRSITFSFTTNVAKNVTTTVSGIFIPPTIELSKTRIGRGEIINIYGQTAPESKIEISIESPEAIVKRTIASEEGDWDYLFGTSILDDGFHIAKAKATSPEGLLSSYSKVLNFYIGEAAPGVICPNADLNGDGRVNLVDFSILLYWWGKANTCADQNRNGKVDLPDFSIMMYYWTG